MAENIKVNPSPIQRNTLDVAMELTKIYMENTRGFDIEKLDETFSRFYAVAQTLDRNGTSALKPFLPEHIKNKLS